MLKKIAKYTACAFLGIIALVILTVLGTSVFTQLPGDQTTNNGQPRQSSYHVQMKDGTLVAVDVWLPLDIQNGQTRPTLFRATRYWRGADFSFWGRVFKGLGIIPNLGLRPDTDFFNQHGYVVVVADARGTGASTGKKPFPISAKETADYAEVMDWIIRQPWSNGQIGSFGISYDGMTAEAMAEQKHPALKAVAPTYMVFDTQYYLATLGGVLNEEFIRNWQTLNIGLDANEGLCNSKVSCFLTKLLINGVRKVDGKPVPANRETPLVLDASANTPFRDDYIYGTNHLQWPDIASYGKAEPIIETEVPIFVFAGWLDAGSADGALARFLTLPNSQQVIIGTLSHGGQYDTDPFKPRGASPSPSYAEQLQLLVDFFDDHLYGTPTPSEKRIKYYTLNDGWRETTVWPPTSRKDLRLALCASNKLCVDQDNVATSRQKYIVDPSTTASTLDLTRWDTPLGGSDVIYEDRNELVGERLSFTSAPLQTDHIVTGSVVLDLFLESDTPDGQLHAYLEHVAANGNITYVTEGAVRLTHARFASCTSDCAYLSEGPGKSYLRHQQKPFTPDEMHKISLSLLATSAKFEAGSSVRITITGADAAQFANHTTDSTPTWHIGLGQDYPSQIILPLEADQTNE